MAIVKRFDVNKEQVTLDAYIIENMSANDVSYNSSFQYDENTVGYKLSELDLEVDAEKIDVRSLREGFLTNFTNKGLWEENGINAISGENTIASGQIRTIRYIPNGVEIIKTSSLAASTQRFILFAYDVNDVYVGAYYNGMFSKESFSRLTELNLTSLKETYPSLRYRISTYSGLTTDDFGTISLFGQVSDIARKEDVENTKKKVDDNSLAIEETNIKVEKLNREDVRFKDVLSVQSKESINKIDWVSNQGKLLTDVITDINSKNGVFIPFGDNAVFDEEQYTAILWANDNPIYSATLYWYFSDKNKEYLGNTAPTRATLPYQPSASGVVIFSPNELRYEEIKGLRITHIELIPSSVYNTIGTTVQYPFIDTYSSRRLDDIENSIENAKNEIEDVVERNNDIVKRVEELRSEIADNAYSTRGKIYGIAYDNNTGKVSRVADAIGKKNKYLVGSEFVGEINDFDHIFPWCEMKMCNIKDGVITYQEEDGFTLDGSNGDVMVEIPKFYSYRKVENDIDTICISGEKKSGFHLEPIFYDSETGDELDYAYIGRYKANFDEDGLHSKSGIAPTCSISYNTLRSKASGNIIDFSTMLALQKLMSIEFAVVDFSRIMGGLSFIPYHGRISAYEDVTNSNTLLVKGVTGYNGADVDASPVECMWVGMQFAFADWVQGGRTDFTPLNNRKITAIEDVYKEGSYKIRRVTFDGAPITTEANKKYLYSTPQESGLTDNLSYHTGRCNLGKWAYGDQFHYRFIEGFIGNCGEIMDGCMVKNLELYFTNDLKKYGNIDNYTKISYKLPLQEDFAAIVVTKMGYDRKNPLVNCPVEYVEDVRQDSFYGDPVFTENDVAEHVAYWGMQLDAGCGNGLYTERFWFERTDTSPLYGTRKIIREKL